MVHKTPVTFYGLNIFGLKYSEQILGSDLFGWRGVCEGGEVGDRRRRTFCLKLFPLVGVILLTSGLVTFSSVDCWILRELTDQ